MEKKLEKKYGLFTAIAMVAGIVIGSGVFFKSGTILEQSGYSIPLSLAAWVVAGLIMLICAYTFCTFANKYPNANGLVGYANILVGKKYGYFLGWFMTTIYGPCMVAVLSWICGTYTCVLFGLPSDYNDASVWAIAVVYMIFMYGINSLAPKIAGKIQISALIIKLIPLILMAIVGSIVGLSNGTTLDNFQHVTQKTVGNPFMGALITTLFAYDGWIIVTSIAPELKNSKRNLPLALMIGSILVIIVYVIYFLGITGSTPLDDFQNNSDSQQVVANAFAKIFSSIAGTGLFVFVLISCLGGLNGMMMSQIRGMASLAQVNQGPTPKTFRQICTETNITYNSGVIGLCLVVFWFFIWFGNLAGWFERINGFDVSSLPVVTVYILYIPLFISATIKHKDMNIFNRFIMPILSLLCCAFLIYAAIDSNPTSTLVYFIVFVVLQVVGFLFLIKRKGKTFDGQDALAVVPTQIGNNVLFHNEVNDNTTNIDITDKNKTNTDSEPNKIINESTDANNEPTDVKLEQNEKNNESLDINNSKIDNELKQNNETEKGTNVDVD